MVETILDGADLLVTLILLAFGLRLCSSFETGLLLLLRLGTVLVQELEELSSRVLIEGVGKLSERRWNL